MNFKDRLKEPTTYIGLGTVAAAFPSIVGIGADKAEIARQGVEAVGAGLSAGLGFFPSLLMALGGALGILLKEKGNG